MPELVAKVDLNINTENIYYLAPPPISIPQLKKGIAFMYGGTQFGDYQDLGDGRSCMIADLGFDGVVIAKGGITTPFTKFGKGYYPTYEAKCTKKTQTLLQRHGINSEKTLAIYDSGVPGVTAIIQRACPYRIGTFEYVSRHHPDKVEELFKHLIINYVDPEAAVEVKKSSDWLGWFRAIIINYKMLFDHWHKTGFIHGCLNTDNMSALAQTIDVQHSFFSYDDSAHSEIDMNGRYSRVNQENAVLFGLNKYRLSLQSLFSDYSADDMYNDFCKGKNDAD